MKLFNNLINFLNDNEYEIYLNKNHIYIKKYDKIQRLTSNIIEIIIKEQKYSVKGNNLYISKLNKNELLIQGQILGVYNE